MNKLSYKKTGRIGLFDKDETSLKLSKLGSRIEHVFGFATNSMNNFYIVFSEQEALPY